MRIFIVVCILIGCLAGCATTGIQRAGGHAQADIEHAHQLTRDKRYPDARSEYERIMTAYPGTPAAAVSRFETALLWLYEDTSDKNFNRAIQGLESFLEDFPDHERSPEAGLWIHMLTMNLEMKKEVTRLNKNIEQLKRLDILHEERRRK